MMKFTLIFVNIKKSEWKTSKVASKVKVASNAKVTDFTELFNKLQLKLKTRNVDNESCDCDNDIMYSIKEKNYDITNCLVCGKIYRS